VRTWSRVVRETAGVEQRFEERTAIVTGAGSGIGRAVAMRLAAEGASVIVVDLLDDRTATVVDEIAAAGGVATAVAADVADQVGVDRVVANAGGRIDVLANVAGIMDGFLPPAEVDDDTWDRVLAVNLTGPMRLTRAVLPSMIAAGHGAIVNVASEAALRASASGVAYTTSKHGLIGLTRSTAVFYAAAGIRCNAVCPGGVMTNLEAAPRSETAMATLSKHLQAIPPPASPEQLAAAICWLASDDSLNVNGAVLASDGGWSAQ
jgi:NAD(P)-dependent dehydrogenase (short-subunit alcohol dehydrogenase family)